MCGFARKAMILSMAILSCGAVLNEARAQIGSSAPGFPRQLTLPPHADDPQSEDNLDIATDTEAGVASVLPDRRACAANVMVIGRPLAGAEAPKLKTATFPAETMPGCRTAAADTDPAPVLAMPPHGVKAAVPAYSSLTQLVESSEASRP